MPFALQKAGWPGRRKAAQKINSSRHSSGGSGCCGGELNLNPYFAVKVVMRITPTIQVGVSDYFFAEEIESYFRVKTVLICLAVKLW